MRKNLEQIINSLKDKFENREVAGVNAVAEYFTEYAVQDFNKIEAPEEIAKIINENLDTNFKKEDVEKIGKIVEAEMNGDIEPVGWDKENNEIDINKINEIYDENREVLNEIENSFEEKKEKAEENLNGEDKQSLIENIAEEAFSNLTKGLKNSDNILDTAIGEMYDRWREEYLEEKENEKKQEEMEEAFNDRNIEENPIQEEQKEHQNDGEYAEIQTKEAIETAEFETGISM